MCSIQLHLYQVKQIISSPSLKDGNFKVWWKGHMILYRNHVTHLHSFGFIYVCLLPSLFGIKAAIAQNKESSVCVGILTSEICMMSMHRSADDDDADADCFVCVMFVSWLLLFSVRLMYFFGSEWNGAIITVCNFCRRFIESYLCGLQCMLSHQQYRNEVGAKWI